MIEATCHNNECAQLDVIEVLRGELRFVQCGVCGEPCDVTVSSLPDEPIEP